MNKISKSDALTPDDNDDNDNDPAPGGNELNRRSLISIQTPSYYIPT